MRAADVGVRIAVAGAAVVGVLTAASGAARADGAFPDSQVILSPVDAPQEIVLVTNFGLVQSEDGGATWLWSCEQTANMYGAFYQFGLPPRHRLYTLANEQVTYSDDRGCGWTASGGLVAVAGGGVSDFWVDRTVVDRVLAVNVTASGSNQRTNALFESTDGGATFGTMLYQADAGAVVTGVESARADPKTIYLTMLGASVDGGAPPPMLARTTDGGVGWQTVDLTAQLGPGTVRLVAVDPTDARKVFLLWSGVDGQALAVTGDGGVTAKMTLVPTGVMKAFVRLDSGTILVSTDDSSTAGLFRSTDGGRTFTALANPPHVRALSERAGTIYAATDNFSEGYAVGTSTDEGTTWKALLAYEDVRGVVPCVKASCQSTCETEVPLLWSEDVCSADVPLAGAGGGGGSGSGTSGGAGGGGGRAIGGGAAGGATGSGGGGVGVVAHGGTHSGCGCEVPSTATPSPGGLGVCLALVLVGFCASLRRQRRRRGDGGIDGARRAGPPASPGAPACRRGPGRCRTW